MLAEYVEQFKRFKVFKAGGVEKVHKPCMLLAVIDLAERGALTENKVRYEDTLDGFRDYAEALRPNEGLEPHFPFYHLRTSAYRTRMTRSCHGTVSCWGGLRYWPQDCIASFAPTPMLVLSCVRR